MEFIFYSPWSYRVKTEPFSQCSENVGLSPFVKMRVDEIHRHTALSSLCLGQRESENRNTLWNSVCRGQPLSHAFWTLAKIILYVDSIFNFSKFKTLY